MLRKLVVLVVTSGVTIALAIGLTLAGRALIWRTARLYPTMFLTAADKEILYARLARDFVGIYDAIPDPQVGKILQRNIDKTQLGAQILSNNAGMRSSRPYVAKPPGTYRIVCLGDSYVEGSGGAEEDRFCDQIEEILQSIEYSPGGMRVETYALGIGGWTATNAASYLVHRLSAYDPDVVIALSVGNDITDGQGVTGIGGSSNDFSPSRREFGSGVFSGALPQRFRIPAYNLLGTDLGPESRTRWEAAFAAWKRLEGVQEERGGRMLFSLMQTSAYYDELTREYYQRSGMQSPFVITSPLGRHLPHDGHPDREGHRIIAVHLLHVLQRLGWIEVDSSELPALDPGLSAELERPSDPSLLTHLRQEAADELPLRIDFDDLDESAVRGLLGGIWPEPAASDPLTAAPYGSTASAFLLKRDRIATTLHVEIDNLPYAELYPQEIRLRIDGVWVDSLRLRSREDAGRHVFSVPLPRPDQNTPAVEVMLRTDSFVSGINDHVMRSYRLLAAWQDR
jgi:lysophospholipase L1-like esterase